MRELDAEGTRYFYFTKADGALLETALGLKISVVPPFMEQQLMISADIRLVLIRGHSRPDVGFVYYLHWDNGQDLDLLDCKVERNTYSDDDFLHSAKTEYQLTRCFHCGKSWSTLVLPLGDPYLGAPGLYEKKIQEHSTIRLCPNCQIPFRQLIVKIF